MDTNKVLENNRYYTPEITEFCPGFECEFKSYTNGQEQWKKRVINIDSFQLDSYEDITYKSNWRVKYLDKQGIEECGLVLWQIPCDSFDWEFYISHNDVSIGSVTFNDDISISELELFGTIFHVKNKIEFKKLLKMLNINI